jgi:hypothetical protein
MKTIHKLLYGILVAAVVFSCNNSAPAGENKANQEDSLMKSESKPEETENELAYLIGQQWVGGFDDNSIVLQIKEVEPEGNGVYKASGFNTVAGNKRPVSGNLTLDGDKVKFTLKEPGDHKQDGTFSGNIYPSEKLAMRGSWSAFRKDRTIGFSLENNNSPEAQERKKEEIVDVARRASEFYPQAECVVVSSKAFFHSSPEYSRQRTAYLIEGDRIVVEKIQRNFVYVQYYNEHSGKSTDGWININDLEVIQ